MLDFIIISGLLLVIYCIYRATENLESKKAEPQAPAVVPVAKPNTNYWTNFWTGFVTYWLVSSILGNKRK